MGFAEAAGVPVVLVADIDRGGVIASLVGTWAVLEPDERARLRGYIVNKFRGDLSLFEDGLAIISERTGLPSFGVVPWFEPARAVAGRGRRRSRSRRSDGNRPGSRSASPSRGCRASPTSTTSIR